jgi:Domain of unknown function DUF29
MSFSKIQAEANTPTSSLYDTDFYAWTQQQAFLLQERQWHQIDLENLIEEIESLGKQQRRELRNRLSVLLGHLLKWNYQAQHRSRSWLATLRIQRLDIEALLQENPSLKPDLEDILSQAYLRGIELAIRDTDLPSHTFPAACPYTLSDILDHHFYPGESSELLDKDSLN